MNVRAALIFIVLIIAGLAVLTYKPYSLSSSRLTQPKQAANVVATPGLAENTLTFCSDPWPPYAGYASANHQGYIVDILREIYQDAGFRIRYINAPWSRCIRDARAGKIHGLAGADVDEVPDFVFPEKTIGITHPAFFVRSENPWQYQGLESLAHIRLGSIQDYTYEKSLDSYIRNQQNTDRVLIIKGDDPLKRLIDAALAGHIDAFVENAPVVNYMLKTLWPGQQKFREAGAPKMGVRLFIPFSPSIEQSVKYAAIFDGGIEALRHSGRLDVIVSGYNMTDWLDEAQHIAKKHQDAAP